MVQGFHSLDVDAPYRRTDAQLLRDIRLLFGLTHNVAGARTTVVILENVFHLFQFVLSPLALNCQVLSHLQVAPFPSNIWFLTCPWPYTVL